MARSAFIWLFLPDSSPKTVSSVQRKRNPRNDITAGSLDSIILLLATGGLRFKPSVNLLKVCTNDSSSGSNFFDMPHCVRRLLKLNYRIQVKGKGRRRDVRISSRVCSIRSVKMFPINKLKKRGEAVKRIFER